MDEPQDFDDDVTHSQVDMEQVRARLNVVEDRLRLVTAIAFLLIAFQLAMLWSGS